jgi:hypothetical protein
MVNWDSEGAVTEFKSDGTPIFHTYMDSGYLGLKVENYRGFRYNWTGIPNEAPAIVALEDEGSINIYVSWNGDTRTKTWRFYELKGGRRSFIGEAPARLSGRVLRQSSTSSVSASTVSRRKRWMRRDPFLSIPRPSSPR